MALGIPQRVWDGAALAGGVTLGLLNLAAGDLFGAFCWFVAFSGSYAYFMVTLRDDPEPLSPRDE